MPGHLSSTPTLLILTYSLDPGLNIPPQCPRPDQRFSLESLVLSYTFTLCHFLHFVTMDLFVRLINVSSPQPPGINAMKLGTISFFAHPLYLSALRGAWYMVATQCIFC